MLAFLAGPAAGAMTGAVVPVDGGLRCEPHAAATPAPAGRGNPRCSHRGRPAAGRPRRRWIRRASSRPDLLVRRRRPRRVLRLTARRARRPADELRAGAVARRTGRHAGPPAHRRRPGAPASAPALPAPTVTVADPGPRPGGATRPLPGRARAPSTRWSSSTTGRPTPPRSPRWPRRHGARLRPARRNGGPGRGPQHRPGRGHHRAASRSSTATACRRPGWIDTARRRTSPTRWSPRSRRASSPLRRDTWAGRYAQRPQPRPRADGRPGRARTARVLRADRRARRPPLRPAATSRDAATVLRPGAALRRGRRPGLAAARGRLAGPLRPVACGSRTTSRAPGPSCSRRRFRYGTSAAPLARATRARWRRWSSHPWPAADRGRAAGPPPGARGGCAFGASVARPRSGAAPGRRRPDRRRRPRRRRRHPPDLARAAGRYADPVRSPRSLPRRLPRRRAARPAAGRAVAAARRPAHTWWPHRPSRSAAVRRRPPRRRRRLRRRRARRCGARRTLRPLRPSVVRAAP